MSKDEQQAEAFQAVVDEELHTLVAVLESASGKFIYAYLVAMDPPKKDDIGDITYNAVMHRWHSPNMLKTHARLVHRALERELNNLKKALNE